MVLRVQSVFVALVVCCAWRACAELCPPRALTKAGWVCGACDPSGKYAEFLAVPYAEQPVGDRRFKQLENLKSWEGCRDATKKGPICHQLDVFYGPLMSGDNDPRGMSEECVHANVYAPLGAKRLPVLVFVHGGGFDFGSGDPDLHGPEYLVREDVVVITFNYRIGAFGFLSLNSKSIPGNAGLRDIVTLLRWVRNNAGAFGGDPGNVTLAGQSAGAAAAHLLSLSKAAEGLFNRVILMSGVASRSFFTTSPLYAQLMSNTFLNYLGIDGTDPEEAHRQLVTLSVQRIMEAHNRIQNDTGLQVFTPVVESEHPEVERILDDDPEILQAQGRGKNIPFLIGFTNAECQTFRPRFEEFDIMKRIAASPELIIPLGVIFTTEQQQLLKKMATIQQEYFNEPSSVENFLRFCTDSYFIYPALKLAEMRAANDEEVFLYRFAYDADYSVFKKALKLKYQGAGHAEDLTFVFRANQALGDTALSAADAAMTRNMTKYFTNFMSESSPIKSDDKDYWPSVKKDRLQYKNIINYKEADPSRSYRRMIKFFDSIYGAAS